jgi:hypothetical protein
VGLLVAVPSLPYWRRLGFYVDDWFFLAKMRQSGGGILNATQYLLDHDRNVRTRPVQAVQQSVLYAAFGEHPLGYQLTLTAALALSAALLYVVLRTLFLSGAVATTVALVYGLSPAYSSDRVWFSALGYSVAMATAFASIYFDLRAVDSSDAVLRWKALALLALLLSGLGYEVALPILGVVPLVLYARMRRRAAKPLRRAYGWPRLALMLGSNVLLLALIMSYKAAASTDVVVGQGGLLRHAWTIFAGHAVVHFGSYGLLLPVAAQWGLSTGGALALVLALIVGVAAGVLVWLAARPEGEEPTLSRAAVTTIAGVMVYLLGYAIYVTTDRIGNSSTGIANRFAIAGAVGAGLVIAGAIQLLAALLGRLVSPSVVTGATAGVFLALFTLVLAGTHEQWSEAAERQQAAARTLDAVAPEPPRNSTILLTGICSYVGQGVVFEAPWEVSGRVQLLYADPTLRGELVTNRMRAEPDAITSTIYGTFPQRYEYGPSLLLVDVRTGQVQPLLSQQDASEALARTASLGCGGEPGVGVRVMRSDFWLPFL